MQVIKVFKYIFNKIFVLDEVITDKLVGNSKRVSFQTIESLIILN